MARDIFISYTTGDRAIAAELCESLESAGLACWIAPRNIEAASSWTASIMNAISECRIMLLVFSSKTNESEHVAREIIHAVETKRRVFPVRIEETVPKGGLAYCLAGLQWFDALKPPLSAHIVPLVAQLRMMLNRSGESSAGLPARAEADPVDIYFECGKCGQEMVAVPAAAGQSTNCPACKSPLIVPGRGRSLAENQRTSAGVNSGGASATQIVPPDAVATIEKSITEVVGPIGGVLLRRALSNTSSLAALRAELLKSIPIKGDQDAFLRRCGGIFGSGTVGATPASNPARPPASPQAATQAPASLDPTAIAELKKTFAAFVGPLAAVLVDRAIARSRSASELLTLLAAELDSTTDRERFTRAVPAAFRQDR